MLRLIAACEGQGDTSREERIALEDPLEFDQRSWRPLDEGGDQKKIRAVEARPTACFRAGEEAPRPEVALSRLESAFGEDVQVAPIGLDGQPSCGRRRNFCGCSKHALLVRDVVQHVVREDPFEPAAAFEEWRQLVRGSNSKLYVPDASPRGCPRRELDVALLRLNSRELKVGTKDGHLGYELADARPHVEDALCGTRCPEKVGHMEGSPPREPAIA
jgi:hypothetical protein